MKIIFYILLWGAVAFETPNTFAAEANSVINPHIIMNTPRTSPYADHPDLWRGRTVLQMQPQPTTQSPSQNNTLPSPEATELTQPENWYPDGEPQADKGTLWEEGASVEDVNTVELHRIEAPAQNPLASHGSELELGGISHQDTVGFSLNTRPFIEQQLKNIDDYHEDALRRKNDQENLVPDSMTGRSMDLDSTWRVSITEPIKIDEDILSSKRNVVGAYANMQGDGLQVFVGPELHIPESSPLQTTPRNMDDTELGLGMQVLWDF